MADENRIATKSWVKSDYPLLIKSNQNTVSWDTNKIGITKIEAINSLNIDLNTIIDYSDNQLVPRGKLSPATIYMNKINLDFKDTTGAYQTSSYNQSFAFGTTVKILVALNYNQNQIRDTINNNNNYIYLFCTSQNYNYLGSILLYHKTNINHSSNASYFMTGAVSNVSASYKGLDEAPYTIYGTGGVLLFEDGSPVPESYAMDLSNLNINGDHTPRILFEKTFKIWLHPIVTTTTNRESTSIKNFYCYLRTRQNQTLSVTRLLKETNELSIQGDTDIIDLKARIRRSY